MEQAGCRARKTAVAAAALLRLQQQLELQAADGFMDLQDCTCGCCGVETAATAGAAVEGG
jgi:hypothetical protein